METEGQQDEAAAQQEHAGHKRRREEQGEGEQGPTPALAPAAAAAAEDGAWRPQAALPREEKMAVGRRCKRLIDAARLRWLRRQGFTAALVRYVPSAVSGENRLLLAVSPAGAAAPPQQQLPPLREQT